MVPNIDLHVASEHISQCRCLAAIRNVDHVDAGHHLEQFARQMACRSVAARRHVDLARVGLGISDELGNGLRRERWVYRHNEGDRDDACDGCDVAEEVEIEFLVKRHIDRGRRADQEEGVAVRRRIHDHLRTNIAAGSRPVLDDKLLAETLRQPLADQTSDDVGRSAGGKWDDDAHRPRRIGLRPRDARHGRQRGSARGQMQKFSAGKFHDACSVYNLAGGAHKTAACRGRCLQRRYSGS